MPTSSPLVIADVIHLVHDVPHRRVLDVGPGWGKYAVLLREYLNERPQTIDAVEAEGSYITAHNLPALYDHVFTGDVCDLPPQVIDTYDLVLMVDVLEHITDTDAEALLTRIPGRVVICTPMEFFSNGPGLPSSETHRSHWPLERLQRLAAAGELGGRHVEVGYTIHGGVMVRLAPLAA